jgi:hypothetical protein
MVLSLRGWVSMAPYFIVSFGLILVLVSLVHQEKFRSAEPPRKKRLHFGLVRPGADHPAALSEPFPLYWDWHCLKPGKI